MVVVFDDEISVVFASNPTDPTCSAYIANKKVMLRITKENTEETKSFNIEVYDQNDVKFLYSGNFSRHKFEEIRQMQNLKYNFDKATDRILTTINDTKKSSDVFICISLNNKNARFEFKRRDEHTDYAVLRLELEAITGSRLNNHLIKFIEKYKKDSEELVFVKRECEQLSLENKKLIEQLAKTNTDWKRKISELEKEKEQIEDDLGQRYIRIQELEDKVDYLESDLSQLKDLCNEMTQKLDLAVTDNEKFVDDLDSKDEMIFNLQEKLLELQAEKKKNKLIIPNLEKKCNDYVTKINQINNEFEIKEKALEKKIRHLLQSEKNLKIELDLYKKDTEALKTHKNLLTTQIKELEQKLDDKIKLEKSKADLLNRRVFNTSRK